MILLAAAGMASSIMSPSDTRVCSTHLQCRAFGDAGAACTQAHPFGQCECSTGYKNIGITVGDVGLPAGSYNTHFCVEESETDATSLARNIPSFVTVTFPDALCSNIPAASGALQRAVEEIFTPHTVAITYTCHQNDGFDLSLGLNQNGLRGVNAAIRINTFTVGDLYGQNTIRFVELMQVKLDAAPTATPVSTLRFLGRVMKNANVFTIEAVPLMCPNEERPGQLTAVVFVEAQQTVAQSSFDQQECESLTCSANYFLVNGVCTLPTPVPPTTDDDLSTGQLTAIIIGSSVAFIAIIVGIVVYCCCRNKREVEPDNNPSDDEKEEKKVTSPDA